MNSQDQPKRCPATDLQIIGMGESRFEFRFSGPDSIPNAVKRHNKQRAAELAEQSRLRSDCRSNAPIFCKVRHHGRDVLGQFTSRDTDVETQFSLNSSGDNQADETGQGDKDKPQQLRVKLRKRPVISKCHHSQDTSETQFFSLQSLTNRKDEESVENERLVFKIAEHKRLCAGCDCNPNCQAHAPSRLKKKPVIRRCHFTQDPIHRNSERLEALHREVCDELESLKSLACLSQQEDQAPIEQNQQSPRRSKVHKRGPEQPSSKPTVPTRGQRWELKLPSRQRKSPAKFPVSAEDVIQRLKSSMLATTEAGHGDGGGRKAHVQKAVKLEYREPEASFVDIIPSAMISQAIEVNVCQAVNTTTCAASQFMHQHRSLEPEPTSPFFREDSDLDHEYDDRSGYLCQRESRPSYNTSQTDEKPLAEERRKKPIFFEMERCPHRLSLLRSLSPLQYTSQWSEETPRGPTSQETLASPSRRHVLPRPRSYKRLLKKHPKMAHKMCTARPRATSETDESEELPTPARALARQPGGGDSRHNRRQPGGGDSRHNRRQPGGRDKVILSRLPAGREKQSLSIPKPMTETSPHQAPTATPSPTRRRKTRPVVFSQSLEDLKYEKLGIYNKISLTQERIISALDRLQNSLLQLQVPECNTLERKKRERNAFEFCVRFSRNFLYPLKGMIDDVRRTPVGYFNSATSNEACQRVVCVYGLMHQSISTYQRQLRFFLLDKVPQKLSALMEMIYTLSSTCVEKGILDRHDPVVECLLERSTKFLTFIEDMQEERFKVAREHYRRSQKQAHPANGNAHSSYPKHPALHSSFHEKKPKHKYDLKMCLNDHKLYEPRLVPKKKPQDLKRSRPVRTRNIGAPAHQPGAGAAQNPIDVHLMRSGMEDVKTQVELDDIPYSKWLGLRTPKTKDAEQKSQKTACRKLQKEDELQQALLEAFRHVSRDQVYQVLDPLMRSLGALLDDKVPKHLR
ncbi:uncharacterized protein [Drosophila pseudoobscura]|uniref:Uncharacterized protein n=1 Tax=Drosophila pseudoobscura pseudoobscura TaxID=46245 RepID=A0A6I8UHR6_DROPS|nr:uncharacterized protein LOC4815954 [Drosophila pseudoobscura]